MQLSLQGRRQHWYARCMQDNSAACMQSSHTPHLLASRWAKHALTAPVQLGINQVLHRWQQNGIAWVMYMSRSLQHLALQ
jgi:hypothetical protein